MDVLGQSEVAAADAIGEAERAALSQLGATERTTISDTGATERIKQQLGKPISLTESERDLAQGSPIFAQKLFSKRLGDRTDIDEVVEEFLENGIPLPKFGDQIIGGLGGTITVNKEQITFEEHYRKSKKNNPNMSYEDIKNEWLLSNPQQ